jgi:GTP cyclohydrolase FolE2
LKEGHCIMRTRFYIAIAASALIAALTVRAADNPPADPTLAGDEARNVSAAVKRDAKFVADAAKDSAQKVAAAAKAVAHEVATASKEGAHEVAATAKRGAAKAKAAVNGEKAPSPPEKPSSPN